MNKRGFTLIELLTVIALLAVIAGIAFPIIQDSIKDSKEKTCTEQKRLIEDAAKRWATDNSSSLPTTSNGIINVTVAQLKTGGYLASNKKIMNPVDNTEMNKSVEIKYNSTYHQHSYTYNVKCTF